MESVWEFKRICRSDLELTDALTCLPKPVGVVVFGPGKNNKFIYAFKICSIIENCTIEPHDQLVETMFEIGRSVVRIMDGESSCSHKRRHEMFTNLKLAGAKTLIGVYVKCPDNMDGYGEKQREELNRQFQRLRRNPPTAEGIDYLIVITPVET